MKVSSRELSQRMDRFQEELRRSGVKLTHQRMEIFRELARSEDHPDADAIWRVVRKRVPTLSLDTVYRTLWLLLNRGLISSLGPSREGTRFDANMQPHHHFVCSECGMTRDFYSEEYDNLEAPQSARSFGEVQTTHVEVRGVCSRCAGRKRRTPVISSQEEVK